MAHVADLKHAHLVVLDLVGTLRRLVRARHGWPLGLGVGVLDRDLNALGTGVGELPARLGDEGALVDLVGQLEDAVIDLPRGWLPGDALRGLRAWLQRDRLIRGLAAAEALEGALAERVASLAPALADVLAPDDGARARRRERGARLPTGVRVTAAG